MTLCNAHELAAQHPAPDIVEHEFYCEYPVQCGHVCVRCECDPPVMKVREAVVGHTASPFISGHQGVRRRLAPAPLGRFRARAGAHVARIAAAAAHRPLLRP